VSRLGLWEVPPPDRRRSQACAIPHMALARFVTVLPPRWPYRRNLRHIQAGQRRSLRLLPNATANCVLGKGHAVQGIATCRRFVLLACELPGKHLATGGVDATPIGRHLTQGLTSGHPRQGLLAAGLAPVPPAPHRGGAPWARPGGRAAEGATRSAGEDWPRRPGQPLRRRTLQRLTSSRATSLVFPNRRRPQTPSLAAATFAAPSRTRLARPLRPAPAGLPDASHPSLGEHAVVRASPAGAGKAACPERMRPLAEPGVSKGRSHHHGGEP
jgi:hypothetical protein